MGPAPPERAAPTEGVELAREHDVVAARHLVRRVAVEAGYDLVTQTKLVTAASELARNTVIHGGGGRMDVERVEDDGRRGLRLVFTDDGPGIPDVDLALTEGWSSGRGLGLGLTGSRRLVDRFDLRTGAGQGTTVTVTMWQRR